MKIPVEWLKQYIKTSKTTKELATEFTALGLMLDKPIFTYEKGKYFTEILDLEHRMDRSDWLSIMGCARDIAAYEGKDLIWPELYTKQGKKPNEEQKVKIEVTCPDLVNRFTTRTFRNIKVAQSPDWLKNRLEAYGIPSINNIVDITNYVMVELGQPMHAQDLAKMEKQEILIRKAKQGEEVTTLLGETVKLNPNFFVLTQNDKATVVGGIVGGKATGVDENTTSIVLDAGNYNQTAIRKNSRQIKIINETVSRYDKFLDPRLTEIAIQRATYLILDIAGGDYYENGDWYPSPVTAKKQTLHLSRVKALSGLEISHEKIRTILSKLEYKILVESADKFAVEIPYFRTDVEVEDDLVADILRVSDYANIPSAMMQSEPPAEITPDIYKFEDKLRNICVHLGLHEHITEPLVAKKDSNDTQVLIENSQSPIKTALRSSIADSLMTVAETYKKHPHITDIKIFEIGKTYKLNGNPTERDSYIEERKLQVIHLWNGTVQEINDKSTRISHGRQTTEILSGILKQLGINDYVIKKEDTDDERINPGSHAIYDKSETTKLGQILNNRFWLYTKRLMKIQQNPRYFDTAFTQERSLELALKCPITQDLGTVQKAISDYSDSITNVQINIDLHKTNQKVKAFNAIIYYTSESETFSQKLLEVLKQKHDTTLR